ncbi:uncharacterized protein LOC132162324 [Corylus avellana]|uniref:uncharacterized protein LOC132162324 n=1 Tax=Corylus avellana TaxID=13451 RepID=UPI00286A2B00|nr:uncharacterized protein LOC132162324 [Corylus avellana]
MTLEILLRNITATGEGFWAPSIGLVPNDIGGIDAATVMLDEDDNVVEDTRDKRNKKFDLAIQCKKRKKGVQIVSQHLSRICDVIESKNIVTSKSYDKSGCNIEVVMDVVQGIAKRENDIDILKFATEVFLKRPYREMFVIIKEPWLQIDFIKQMGIEKLIVVAWNNLVIF